MFTKVLWNFQDVLKVYMAVRAVSSKRLSYPCYQGILQGNRKFSASS